MFILTLIDGRNFILTPEQSKAISESINDPSLKNIILFGNTIIIHQITGITDLDLYRSQMKTALQSKNQKLCKRCGTIVSRTDKCPCGEKPEKFPDILDLARSYNHELAKQLDAIAEQKQLSALPLEPHPKMEIYKHSHV